MRVALAQQALMTGNLSPAGINDGNLSLGAINAGNFSLGAINAGNFRLMRPESLMPWGQSH